MCAFPVLVIPPRARLGPLECSDEIRSTYAINPRGEENRRGSPNSAAMVSAVMSSMPPKASQALDARAQRLERGQFAQFGFDRVQPGDRFIDGSHIRAMRLVERRQRPRLCPHPDVMFPRPGVLGGREATAVP